MQKRHREVVTRAVGQSMEYGEISIPVVSCTVHAGFRYSLKYTKLEKTRHKPYAIEKNKF